MSGSFTAKIVFWVGIYFTLASCIDSFNRQDGKALTMTISNADKKRFRQIGHQLNPVVTIAQKGLSENVREEVERALADHELIKIKIAGSDRTQKQQLTRQICADFRAECVQSIGHVLLLYRAAAKPDPRLSNLKRDLGS